MVTRCSAVVCLLQLCARSTLEYSQPLVSLAAVTLAQWPEAGMTPLRFVLSSRSLAFTS